jgi:hypothetical protein
MKTRVIFDSQGGNTERLAEVIARRLGADTPLWAADGAAKTTLERGDWDLLIIGAPTQNHTVSPTMRAATGSATWRISGCSGGGLRYPLPHGVLSEWVSGGLDRHACGPCWRCAGCRA